MLADRVGAMSARPGRFIEIIETGWPRERNSTIVAEPTFGEITGRLWERLRGESLKALGHADLPPRAAWRRNEPRRPDPACWLSSQRSARSNWRAGSDFIDHRTMIPPSEMASALCTPCSRRVSSMTTLRARSGMIALVVALSVVFGFAAGLVIHALPRLRAALDPFFATYYAVPIFIFYPVLIAIFGLSLMPIVLIGVATAIVAMIIATLNGLDRIPRVLTKVARVHRMGRLATALQLQLPAAAPYLFTGVKLSVSYAFIAVIAAEFILSPAGLGRAIANAYADFDNRRMYALMLFVLIDRDRGQCGPARLGYALGETARREAVMNATRRALDTTIIVIAIVLLWQGLAYRVRRHRPARPGADFVLFGPLRAISALCRERRGHRHRVRAGASTGLRARPCHRRLDGRAAAVG